MNRLIFTVLLYGILCTSILVSHRLSPTGMCGPGLELFVALAAAILTIAFFARSLIKLRPGDKISRLNLLINVAGLIAVGIMFYMT